MTWTLFVVTFSISSGLTVAGLLLIDRAYTRFKVRQRERLMREVRFDAHTIEGSLAAAPHSGGAI